MTVELANGTRLEARDVFGGPRMVNGVIRDVLRLEFDLREQTFLELRTLFRDNPATDHLFTYDDEGNKLEMGNGYNIFISIADEQRTIKNPPGVLAKEEVEDVFVVQLAQQTLAEHAEWLEAHNLNA